MDCRIQIVADLMPENVVSISLLKKHGFTLNAANELYKLDICNKFSINKNLA